MLSRPSRSCRRGSRVPCIKLCQQAGSLGGSQLDTWTALMGSHLGCSSEVSRMRCGYRRLRDFTRALLDPTVDEEHRIDCEGYGEVHGALLTSTRSTLIYFVQRIFEVRHQY